MTTERIVWNLKVNGKEFVFLLYNWTTFFTFVLLIKMIKQCKPQE
jgi:hypothetical protein